MDLKSISKNGIIAAFCIVGFILCAAAGAAFLLTPLDEPIHMFFSLISFGGAVVCAVNICMACINECSNRYCNMKYVNLESVPVVIWYMTYLMFRGCRIRKVVVAPGQGIAFPNADPVKAVKIEDMPG